MEFFDDMIDIIIALHCATIRRTNSFFPNLRKSRQDSFRHLLKEQLKIDSAKDARYSDLVFLQPNRSFSIIFRGERTLDLMTAEDIDRDKFLDALDHIICAYQAAMVKVGKDVLLLRYIWLDVDKVSRSLSRNFLI
jgi:hypothetical protein